MSDLNFTPIYERARSHFSITRDEYALCNYVQTWSAHPDNKRPGWCDRTREQMARWMGITERGVRKMIERLVSEGLLDKAEDSRHLRVTRDWFQVVNQAKAEQSSGTSPEQSSGEKRNKVPEKAEQSSGEKRNKVPTHNNTNSNYSNSNSKNNAVLAETLEIVTYLNELCGTSYRPQTKQTSSMINARIKDGFTVDDFKLVIAHKTRSWLSDEKMRNYLRPETLFCEKHFEGYVNAAKVALRSPSIQTNTNGNERGKTTLDPATRLERALANGQRIADEIAAGKL